MTKFEKELLKELRELKEEIRRSKEPQFTFTPVYIPPTVTTPVPNPYIVPAPYIGDLPPWGTTTCHLEDLQTYY
jgi:hypothetical protein